MGASRESRNGTAPTRPTEGERGVTGAFGYSGESLFRYGKRRPPTPVQLHDMFLFDPWAEAIEGALTWPIRSAGWTITPAEGDTGEAEEALRQFRPIANRTIAGMLQAVGRGVARAEQVWARPTGAERGRRDVLVDVAFRPVGQCEPVADRNGRQVGFRQRAYQPGRGFVTEEFLREESKSFVYLHDEASRPGVGKSALEAAYQHYEDKQKLAFYRYKSLEKYGGPSTVIETDAPEGTPEHDAAIRTANEARSGAGIVIGTGDRMYYLDPPNSGDAFGAARRDLNFEMAVSCFVQHLSLAQEGNSGAYELSRDHSDFLTIITEGRMNEGAGALTSGPLYDITFHNRGPNAAFPIFEFAPISEHISKRMIEGAKLVFDRNGIPMPKWLAEGIATGFGKSLDIERPEDADPVGEPRPFEVQRRDRGEPRERGDE